MLKENVLETADILNMLKPKLFSEPLAHRDSQMVQKHFNLFFLQFNISAIMRTFSLNMEKTFSSL